MNGPSVKLDAVTKLVYNLTQCMPRKKPNEGVLLMITNLTFRLQKPIMPKDYRPAFVSLIKAALSMH
jgi:hypothetical protein